MKKPNSITKLFITLLISATSIASFALGPINTSFGDDDPNILLTDIVSIECYEAAISENAFPNYCSLVGWTIPEIKLCKAFRVGPVTVGISCPKTPTVCQLNPVLCGTPPPPPVDP